MRSGVPEVIWGHLSVPGGHSCVWFMTGLSSVELSGQMSFLVITHTWAPPVTWGIVAVRRWTHKEQTNNRVTNLLNSDVNYRSFVGCNVMWVLVNSLEPSGTIWRYRSGSTLAQLLACCLMVPSHYLKQCWLIINEIQWQHLGASSQPIPHPFHQLLKLAWTCLTWLRTHALPVIYGLNIHEVESLLDLFLHNWLGV